jgi:hypothetical protein
MQSKRFHQTLMRSAHRDWPRAQQCEPDVGTLSSARLSEEDVALVIARLGRVRNSEHGTRTK